MIDTARQPGCAARGGPEAPESPEQRRRQWCDPIAQAIGNTHRCVSYASMRNRGIRAAPAPCIAPSQIAQWRARCSSELTSAVDRMPAPTVALQPDSIESSGSRCRLNSRRDGPSGADCARRFLRHLQCLPGRLIRRSARDRRQGRKREDHAVVRSRLDWRRRTFSWCQPSMIDPAFQAPASMSTTTQNAG